MKKVAREIYQNKIRKCWLLNWKVEPLHSILSIKSEDMFSIVFMTENTLDRLRRNKIIDHNHGDIRLHDQYLGVFVMVPEFTFNVKFELGRFFTKLGKANSKDIIGADSNDVEIVATRLNSGGIKISLLHGHTHGILVIPQNVSEYILGSNNDIKRLYFSYNVCCMIINNFVRISFENEFVDIRIHLNLQQVRDALRKIL